MTAAEFFPERFKALIAQITARHFNGASILAAPAVYIEVDDRQWNIISATEFPAEIFIAHTLISAQMKVAVHGLHSGSAPSECQKKRHAVSPSAESYKHFPRPVPPQKRVDLPLCNILRPEASVSCLCHIYVL